MIRPTLIIVAAGVLGLSMLNCAGSTPPSKTPATHEKLANDVQPTPGEPGSPASNSDESAQERWYAGQNERVPTSGRDESALDAQSGTTPAVPLTDAQIAGVTDTIHQSEIQQAKLAQKNSTSPRVLGFAQMMIADHGQAREKQASLGLSTASSPLLQTLSAEGEQTYSQLESKSGSDFDRAYLQAQIAAHQRALETIDRQLLPQAKSARMQQQLQNMRGTLQHHLQAARDALRAL
jgi:putative membrane protein